MKKQKEEERESVAEKSRICNSQFRGWVEHCLHSLSVQLLCASSIHRTCSDKLMIVQASCYGY